MVEWLCEPVLVSKWFGRLAQALFIIGICGAVSVLLDVDHVLFCIVSGTPITWENLARNAGRPLHIPAVVIVGVLCLIGHARFDRLLERYRSLTRKIVKVK